MESFCCVNIHFFGQTEEYSYRSAVRELVPQLRYLDDVPVEEAVAECRAPADEDLALLKESIKENASSSNLQYLGRDRAVAVCRYVHPFLFTLVVF